MSTVNAVTAKRAPKKTPAEAARKQPRLTCRFYRTDLENEPVREWLKELPANVRKEIGSDIATVQWSWPVGKPLVDGFGDGLYEVRSGIDGNIYRVLFCLDGSVMVLLHGFMKKTRKTPNADKDLALKRMREEEEES
jgi:phage-related protein